MGMLKLNAKILRILASVLTSNTIIIQTVFAIGVLRAPPKPLPGQ